MTTEPEPPLVDTEVVACQRCGSDAYSLVGTARDFELSTCRNEFTFVRCRACGLVYLRERPTAAMLPVIYPDTYTPYQYEQYLTRGVRWLREKAIKKKVRWLASLVPPDALIVDVGCGSGDLLRELKQFGPSSWRLVGIDFSPAAVANLERLGIEGFQGRFEDVEWKGRAPDLLILAQVIEHLENPFTAMRRAYELLPPGGSLVIETPALDGWDARLFARKYWGGWQVPRHWTLFEARILEDSLERAGFTIARREFLLSPNCWLLTVQNWISDRLRLPRLARWFDWRRPVPLVAACAVDAVQLVLTGHTSNLRVIAKKPVATRP